MNDRVSRLLFPVGLRVHEFTSLRVHGFPTLEKHPLGNGGGFSRLEFSDQYQSGRQRKFRILLIPAPAFRTCINDIDDTHSSVDDKYLIFRTLCMSGTPTAIKYPGVFFDVYQNIFS